MYAHCFGRLLSLCNSLGVGKLQPLQVSHNLRKFVRICNCLQNWSRQLFFFANIGVYSTSKEVSKAPSVIDHGGACSSPNILPVQSLPQKTCKRILNCPSYASFVQRRYQLFHKTGRMQFDKVKPSNPGMPSGYLEFLIGGGPCIYRLNLLNLALKTVPHRIL